MEEFVSMIVGDSTTLDVYFIARVIVMFTALEIFTIACGMLGSMKRR